MGKKRRSTGKGTQASEDAARPVSEPRTRLNVQSWEDVADSEDEFALNQDKLLLEEGPAREKRRKLDEEAAFFEASDEDVLPVPDTDSDLGDDGATTGPDGGLPTKGLASRSKTALGGSDDEEGLAGWGNSRRDYYDADRIETEADALEEEKEARRLQKKQLQEMRDEDYGFDEVNWLQDADSREDIEGAQIIREILPKLEITDSMKDDAKLEILLRYYPEFEYLPREFVALRDEFVALDGQASSDGEQVYDPDRLPIHLVKRNILASHLGSLAMYFALLSSGEESPTGQRLAKAPAELHNHPVMDTLVATRAMWEKVKAIESPEPHPPVELRTAETKLMEPLERVSPAASDSAPPKSTKAKKSHKSKAQLEAEKALKQAAAQRAARLQRVSDELSKLGASAPTSATPRPSHPTPDRNLAPSSSDAGSDFGEVAALTAEEAEDKARRKRGLRFHTSKITAKSLKRDRASREGGDIDIPYRERLRDRQARLNEAAEKRGSAVQDPRAALDGEMESDDDDRAARAALRDDDGEEKGEEVEDEDYYDVVAARTKRRKEAKAAAAVARHEERITGRVRDEEGAAGGGKRELTWTIEKNKGLTPKRKKEGRNPRVKKRNRYEEKMKKLSSVRPVYKGGEGRGGYGGEKTGIRKNLVKSVKL